MCISGFRTEDTAQYSTVFDHEDGVIKPSNTFSLASSQSCAGNLSQSLGVKKPARQGISSGTEAIHYHCLKAGKYK